MKAARSQPAEPQVLTLLLVALLLSVLQCTVQLVSTYNEHLDQPATTLQLTLDAFLAGLETAPRPANNNDRQFYTDYRVRPRAARLRAKSHADSMPTAQPLGVMKRNLNKLRTMHESGDLDAAAVATTCELLSLGWQAISSFKLATKSGDEHAKEEPWQTSF